MGIGDNVFSEKFGLGTILEIENGIALIKFNKSHYFLHDADGRFDERRYRWFVLTNGDFMYCTYPVYLVENKGGD